jgi:hypothetical protein
MKICGVQNGCDCASELSEGKTTGRLSIEWGKLATAVSENLSTVAIGALAVFWVILDLS